MRPVVAARAGQRPLLFALVVDGAGSGLFRPFAVLYFLHTTAIPLPTIGVCLTAASLLALATPPAVGPLIDRFGPRALVVVGNLLSAAAFAAYLRVECVWELVAAAFVAGVGQSTCWTALVSLVGVVAPAPERARWFALQSAFRNAGYGLGGLSGAILVGLGRVWAYPLLAGVNAASFLAVAAMIGSWRATLSAPAGTGDGDAKEPARYADVVRDRRLLLINCTNILLVICMNVLSVLTVVYLTDVLHQSAWVGGVMFTLNTVVVVAAQTAVTKRTSGHRRSRTVQAAAAVWALAFACLWLLNAAPARLVVPGAVVAVCALTLAEMLYAPTINALAVDMAPAHVSGRYLAAYQLSWGIGGAVAPGLLVWLLSSGAQSPWPVLIAFCGTAALFVGKLADRRRPDERCVRERLAGTETGLKR